MIIRPFEHGERDYKNISDIWNAIFPNDPVTVQEIKFDFENMPKKIKWQSFFVEQDNRPIAQGGYRHFQSSFHPQKFMLSIRVLPDYRRQGIGTNLYKHILEQLEPLNPKFLKAFIDDDGKGGLEFARKLGFTEEARYWESRLAVLTFDASPYKGLEAHVNAQGIKLVALTELMKSHADYKRRIFELDWECTQDEPQPDAPTKPEYEPWIKHQFENPNFTPEAFLVAVQGDDWLGFNELSVNKETDGGLRNGFTALKRSARGKGVATALKVKNIIWAQGQGFKEIRTGNNSLNEAMLKINTKLGFKKQVAEVGLKKEL